VPPIASLVIDNAPAEVAGTASGVLNTFRQLGGSLGVASVGAVIAGHTAFMDGLRVGLAATVVTLGITAALSPTLHP
jgi:MFS transporter, DHA2 family, methylenomycin A resistance protein